MLCSDLMQRGMKNARQSGFKLSAMSTTSRSP